jgi:hypothetical protein
MRAKKLLRRDDPFSQATTRGINLVEPPKGSSQILIIADPFEGVRHEG